MAPFGTLVAKAEAQSITRSEFERLIVLQGRANEERGSGVGRLLDSLHRSRSGEDRRDGEAFFLSLSPLR